MSISLAKNEKLSLEKEDGSALKRVVLGLGWDAAPKKGLFGSRATSIDLDASAILLDAGKNVVDTVWFQKLRSSDGSIKHTGDNLTGEGDGDDEQIKVELDQVSSQVTAIVLVVSSYTGQTFDKVQNVFARVVDGTTNNEVVRYDLRDLGSKTGSVVAKLVRTAGGWDFVALGEAASGRTVKDFVPAAKAAA